MFPLLFLGRRLRGLDRRIMDGKGVCPHFLKSLSPITPGLKNFKLVSVSHLRIKLYHRVKIRDSRSVTS